jgi:hypothetical protein
MSLQPEGIVALHNTQEGRCFILGNGPSLIAQLPLLEKLGKESTFVCNGMVNWDALPFTPSYFVVTDLYKKKILTDFARRAWEGVSRYQIGWEDSYKAPEFEWILKAYDAKQIHPHGFVGLDDYLPAIPTGRTTPLTIAQFAAWIGYRELYFLGIEQTVGYCYNPAATESPQGHSLDYNSNPRYQNSIQRCFTRARHDLEAVGGAIYDCTPQGFLNRTGKGIYRRGSSWRTILEYRSLEEVLA